MSIAQQHFTDAGRSMLGRAQANELLTIDRIVVGSGVLAVPAQIYPLVDLVQLEYDVTIFSRIDDGMGTLTIEGTLNHVNVTAPFDLCELGVMAHIAAEPPRLYSAANVFLETPDTITPSPTGVSAFKIKLVIDRATNVVVTLGTSADILAENIGVETLGPGWFKEKIGNTLRFKRAVAGYGIELEEDPLDPFTVEIRQKVLEVDLDLYVPLTHPDGTPETRFPTIQEAYDSLAGILIPVDRRATIHVDGVLLNHTNAITCNHPQGERISILGVPPITTTGTFVSLTGAGPVYQLTFNVADATNIAPLDFISIGGDGSQVSSHTLGVWQVGSVVGTTVTVGIVCWVTAGAPIWSVPATITIYPSKLYFNGLINGFNIGRNGLASLTNFLIRSSPGNNSRIGVSIASPPTSVRFESIAMNGWNGPNAFGILVGNSGNSISLSNVYLSDNFRGLTVSSGASGSNNSPLVVTGNAQFGFWVEGASFSGGAVGSQVVAAGNGDSGILADNNGTIALGDVTNAGTSLVCQLNIMGIRASYNGFFRHLSGGAARAFVNGNAGGDAIANYGGKIMINANNIDSGGYSPGNNTNDVSGAWVLVTL